MIWGAGMLARRLFVTAPFGSSGHAHGGWTGLVLATAMVGAGLHFVRKAIRLRRQSRDRR